MNARNLLVVATLAVTGLALTVGCGSKAQPAGNKNAGRPEATSPSRPGSTTAAGGRSGTIKPSGPARPATVSPPHQAPEIAVAAKQPKAGNDSAAAPQPAQPTAEPSAQTPATDLSPAQAEAKPAESTVERFLLLGPEFPIVVEAALSVDGEPLESAFARLLDNVIQAADTDGDGKATWKEVSASEAFIYGAFGNAPAADAAAQMEMVRMYDGNRNGLFDRAEAPRFITRNAGGGRAFSLRNSNYYRHRNRRLSPLRKLLDANEDGVLDEVELAAAEQSLRSRDDDDDALLTRADFSSPRPDMLATAGRLPSLTNSNDPDTAVWLGSNVDWGGVLYLLQEHYAYGGDLERESFAALPELFDKLDASSDGLIDKQEIERLASIPAHISLRVRFGEEPSDGAPQLELIAISEELSAESAVIASSKQRLALSLPGMNVEWFVNDGAGAGTRARADAALAMYDSDKNGYLEAEEAPSEEQGFVGRFEGIDANRDGKIYAEEIEGFLRTREASARSQVRARAADQEDAFFAALDASGDGRLDAREIAAAGKRLAGFDKDGDGQVGIHEIPLNMAVAFVRGDVQQDDVLFTLPAAGPTAVESAPTWFVKTDANRDGYVSAEEFLGDAATLSRLDADGDGFLSVQEAQTQ